MRNVQVICPRSLFWGYSLERRISENEELVTKEKNAPALKFIWRWNLKMFEDLNVMFQTNTSKEQNK